MAFRTKKISQMDPKGSNLAPTDLLEISELVSGSYVTKSITGQEIIDSVPPATVEWGSIGGDITAQNDLQLALDSKFDVPTGNTTQYLDGAGTPTTLNKSAVGLGNVDNTSDLNKPISTATQTALNAKQNSLVSGTNIKTINSNSILGSGDVAVQSTLVSGTNIKTINGSSILGSGNLAVGSVTGVSATSPLTSSGGSTPSITISQATTSTNGYLSSTDWNTFNGKQGALTLTTTGTSGASTLIGNTLNIPQYASSTIWGGITGTLSSQTDLQTALNAKQATLTSGSNIKTINGNSVLGSGDLVIGGSSGLLGYHVLTKPVTGKWYDSRIYQANPSISSSNANRLYLIPFTPANTLTGSAFIVWNTALAVTNNVRVVVYSDSNGTPNTKLYESASIPLTSTGVKSISASFTFTAGTTYWIGTYKDGAVNFYTYSYGMVAPIFMNTSSQAIGNYYYDATFGSAPTTIITANLGFDIVSPPIVSIVSV